jgi:tripartite-type tricarboxylate transporter receptor subunit TctC
MFATAASAIEYVRSGNLRDLGVTGADRLETAFPQLSATYLPGAA